jgi:ketosteroid isomerase-like protein
MLPHKPQDWPALFTQQLNAGNLDAVMALYEPDARFVAASGETVAGSDRIREALSGLVRAKTKLHSRVIKAVGSGDVALLYTDFEGSALDPTGKTVERQYHAIEVLRPNPTALGNSLSVTPTAADEGVTWTAHVRNNPPTLHRAHLARANPRAAAPTSTKPTTTRPASSR